MSTRHPDVVYSRPTHPFNMSIGKSHVMPRVSVIVLGIRTILALRRIIPIKHQDDKRFKSACGSRSFDFRSRRPVLRFPPSKIFVTVSATRILTTERIRLQVDIVSVPAPDRSNTVFRALTDK